MKKRKQRGGLALALATVMVSPPFLAGCGALAWRTAPTVGEALHLSPPRQLVIAQIRYGNDARFELCPVDSCPKPTPKTLAGQPQALTAPMPLAAAPLLTPPSASMRPAALIDSVSPAPAKRAGDTPQARTTATKTVVVAFASGSALLTSTGKRELAAIVPDARRSRVIEIRGRTDELGSSAINEVLARNRALAVRDYLRAQDLPEETTIRLSFKGACCYVAGNDTAEGRAANRRVEIEWQPGLQLAQRTTHEQH